MSKAAVWGIVYCCSVAILAAITANAADVFLYGGPRILTAIVFVVGFLAAGLSAEEKNPKQPAGLPKGDTKP